MRGRGPTPSFIRTPHFLAANGLLRRRHVVVRPPRFLVARGRFVWGIRGFLRLRPQRRSHAPTVGRSWTETFLGLSDNYYLIDTTTILPEPALKASGHVDHFTDILVTCTRCGESYRGDQLIEAATHEEHEGLTAGEIDARIRDLKHRCPNCT